MLEKTITRENWKDILQQTNPMDIETIAYFKEHEEEILDILLSTDGSTNIEEKRRQYVHFIIKESVVEDDFDRVYSKIDEIRQNHNMCILQFGKRLSGSSNTVFEFGNKILKYGKPFEIVNNRHVLQPEFQMDLEEGYRRMTVFERLPIVYTVDDRNIAQEMYNRIRDDGLVWFDAIGYNVGRTENVRDSSDDGLRIIDGQYMEYERDIFARIQPERNKQYMYQGPAAYSLALKDYILSNGYGAFEKTYQEMVQKRRNIASKKDIEVVARQSSIGGLEKVKMFFSNLFKRKEKPSKDER